MKKLVLLILCLMGVFFFLVKRESPYSILNYLGLELSNHNEIIEFKNTNDGLFNLQGDGIITIHLKLCDADLSKVKDYFLSKKLENLPLSNKQISNLPYRFKNTYLSKGYFSLKIDSTDTRNYELLLFDEKRQQVLYINESL